jgi:cytochrome c-type biogenesis protein CcmE
MKKIHIILLVFIAAAIVVLVSFMGSLTTYDTIETAKQKEGKFVHLIAKLDKTKPIEYDAIKNPNFLSFTAIDSLGGTVKVIYHNAKPDHLEMTDRLVIKGAMEKDHFDCKEIMMKCPSKYKDDMKSAEKNLPAATAATYNQK